MQIPTSWGWPPHSAPASDAWPPHVRHKICDGDDGCSQQLDKGAAHAGSDYPRSQDSSAEVAYGCLCMIRGRQRCRSGGTSVGSKRLGFFEALLGGDPS